MNYARLIVAAALLTACGDDTPIGDFGGVNTGLDPALELSLVTAEEAGQACSRIQNGLESVLSNQEVKKLVCLWAASVSSQRCEESFDNCESSGANVTNPYIPDPEVEICDGGSIIGGLSGCGLLVSDLETCVNESLSALKARVNRTTCDREFDGIRDLETDPWIALSCNVIKSDCGSILP